VFVTEFWDGWFTHWGEKYHTVSLDRLTSTLEYLLSHQYSVNFYMLHGKQQIIYLHFVIRNPKNSYRKLQVRLITTV